MLHLVETKFDVEPFGSRAYLSSSENKNSVGDILSSNDKSSKAYLKHFLSRRNHSIDSNIKLPRVLSFAVKDKQQYVLFQHHLLL